MSRELSEALENFIAVEFDETEPHRLERYAQTIVALLKEAGVRGVLDLMGQEYEESQVCIEHHTDFRGYCSSGCRHAPTIVVRVEGD